MEIDPDALTPGALYKLMISLIVPRPIAFVTSLGPSGLLNAAPFSYFAPISSRPPMLAISVNSRHGAPKDTLANIQLSREFVVNLVNELLLDAMVQASGEWPPEVSEVALTGLVPVASSRIRTPGLAASPVRFECRLERAIPIAETTLVIGQIVRGHADDEVLTEGLGDVRKLKPVGRLGGEEYALVSEVVRRARPRVERKPA